MNTKKIFKLVLGASILATLFMISGCVSQSSYNNILQQNKDMRASLEQVNNQITNANKANTDLQKNIDMLNQKVIELTAENRALETKTPRHFIDRGELLNWRTAIGIIGTNTSWVDRCILLQQKALKDGFITSLDIDIYENTLGISLTVIAGDGFYCIYPDDLTINYITSIN